ncbi:hypothetical protein ACJMK2_041566 [Sinanodonta woodiana]|uniref:C2H2-type domain-containing protein n=1 Tax=Sinanodonta woodiana TaxID=1069815 RepID=A0ABD3W7U4_SINWO
MNGHNGSNMGCGGQMPSHGQGSIPALRVQSETPTIPSTRMCQFPALPSPRSLVQGKTVPNGRPDKSPFATPRVPNSMNGMVFSRNSVKQDLNSPQLFGVGMTPKLRQGFGHNNASSFANPNSKLNLPNNRLENATPTPSEVSSINSTPRNVHTPLSMVSGTTGRERNIQTPVSNVDKVFLEPYPVKQEWNPYKPLPHVGVNGSITGNDLDQQSQCSQQVPPSSASTRYQTSHASTSLSPHLAMETSPTGSTGLGSTYTSPRHSAHQHSRMNNKRALSLSPVSGEFDFNYLIRTSPTSLVAFINGQSRSSSTTGSPQPLLNQQHGHFGHLIARNAGSHSCNGSPYSGSASSNQRACNFATNRNPGMKQEPGFESDMQDYFQDIVSNQIVMQQNDIPYWEQRAFQDIQQFGTPRFTIRPENMVQPPGVNGNVSGPVNSSMNGHFMSNVNNTTNVHPPPPYNQAMNQQHLGTQQTTQQSPQEQNFQPNVPQPLSQHNNINNINNINNMNNLSSNMYSQNSNVSDNINDIPEDGEFDENGEKQNICRWIDCNALFKEQDELVRHIEKVHIDQRKGEDFTCFWSGCQRRFKPFNARYKLLIHMRVHSGEKPNKCTFEGCNKAFSRLENLKIHLRSHTGERPYICQHAGCTKAFSNSSDRAKHQRTHLDTKPYACQVPGCNKRYTDPSSLRKHVKNHNQKDPQQKKKLKREIDASPGQGQGMLGTCLTISQLRVENGKENMENGMAQPLQTGTELYPNFSLGLSGTANTAPAVESMQNSPISMPETDSSKENIAAYPPAPPSVMNTGRRPHPALRRGFFPGMDESLAPPPYPHADEMYQQWVEAQQQQQQQQQQAYSVNAPVPMARYGPLTYNTGQCRMENINMQDFQIQDFAQLDMQRGTSGFDFDQDIMGNPFQEDAQQQYMQVSAIDRCSSRLSAIYADGAT